MTSITYLNVQQFAEWLETHHKQAAALSVVLAITIAIVDWHVGANVSLGALYVFAILFASLSMPRTGLVLFALVCAVLREAFGPFQWQPAYEVRLALVGGAFWGVGTLVAELNRNRKLVIENLRQREQYLVAKQESEKQLSTLVDTSPVPILIVDRDGLVLVANEACHHLLESTREEEVNLFEYLPELRRVVAAAVPSSRRVRREIECSGRTRSGEAFFAHVWLTGYSATAGDRFAVVLWDASEDLRGREIAQVESVTATSRVLISGFAHEVKNIVQAAATLCARLATRCGLESDAEYQSVASTMKGLSELAASGLRLRPVQVDAAVDLSAAMQQIRIVVQPMLDTARVKAMWDLPERLPRVRADHTALIQVFLNLARNSVRAMQGMPDGEFRVDAVSDDDGTTITVCDNGPGISDTEHLFEPFRSGAGSTGLGLYISRVTLRSCGGDLWYEPGRGGACFCIRLLPARTE